MCQMQLPLKDVGGFNQIKALNNWFIHCSDKSKQATALLRYTPLILWAQQIGITSSTWLDIFTPGHRWPFFVVDTNKSPRGKGEGEIQLKARQWKTAEAYLALISWLTRWEVHRWLTLYEARSCRVNKVLWMSLIWPRRYTVESLSGKMMLNEVVWLQYMMVYSELRAGEWGHVLLHFTL